MKNDLTCYRCSTWPCECRDGQTIIHGDCREVLAALPSESMQCCITSPPYWGLRDYGHDSQLGLEGTPDEYVANMVAVFREVWRVLRKDGTVWLNLGDSYASTTSGTGALGGSFASERSQWEGHTTRTEIPSGLKPKDLCGIPWRVAFALQADGWWLRQEIIWSKPNPMPESVTDRCTKSHESIFLLAKSKKYYYDAEAIAEKSIYGDIDKRSGKGNIRYEGKRTSGDPSKDGQQSFVTIDETRNRRSVWTITTKPYKAAHFATFPPDLIEPCIKAGCPEGGTVLDPFNGSGTTGDVCRKLGRKSIGIELNAEYNLLAAHRLRQEVLF